MQRFFHFFESLSARTRRLFVDSLEQISLSLPFIFLDIVIGSLGQVAALTVRLPYTTWSFGVGWLHGLIYTALLRRNWKPFLATGASVLILKLLPYVSLLYLQNVSIWRILLLVGTLLIIAGAVITHIDAWALERFRFSFGCPTEKNRFLKCPFVSFWPILAWTILISALSIYFSVILALALTPLFFLSLFFSIFLILMNIIILCRFFDHY